MLRLLSIAALSGGVAASSWTTCSDALWTIAKNDGFTASPGGPERKMIVGRKPDGFAEGDDVCIELNNEGENVDVQVYDLSLAVEAIHAGIREALGIGPAAICFFLPDGTLLGGEKSLQDYGLAPGDNMYAVLRKDVEVTEKPWFKRGAPDKTCSWVAAFTARCEVVGDDGRRASEACDACGGSVAPTPEGYTPYPSHDVTEKEDSVDVRDLEGVAWVAKYWNGAAKRGGDPDPYKGESIIKFVDGRVYGYNDALQKLGMARYKSWGQTLDKLPTTIHTEDKSGPFIYSMDGNGNLVVEFGKWPPGTIVYEKQAWADVYRSQYWGDEDDDDDDDDRAGSKSVGCLIVLMCLIAFASFVGGLFVGKRCAREPPRAAVVVSLPTKLDKQVSA